MRSHFWEGIRFLFIGVIAVAIDFVVYFLLFHITSLPTPVSKATSFICGALFSFVGHRLFVFKAHETAAKKQALPFILLYLTSLLLNNLINEGLLYSTKSSLIAWFAATAASVIWNYLGLKFIVFQKKADTIIS